MKHTPGPWRVYDLTKCVVGPESEGNLVVAEAHHWRSEARANAFLIAAAPELLDAITGLLATPESASAREAAIAAIKKARPS